MILVPSGGQLKAWGSVLHTCADSVVLPTWAVRAPFNCYAGARARKLCTFLCQKVPHRRHGGVTTWSAFLCLAGIPLPAVIHPNQNGECCVIRVYQLPPARQHREHPLQLQRMGKCVCVTGLQRWALGTRCLLQHTSFRGIRHSFRRQSAQSWV